MDNQIIVFLSCMYVQLLLYIIIIVVHIITVQLVLSNQVLQLW